MVVAAQSVEGLHDDASERDRLLNSASTIVALRLADPDPVVTRAGTVRRPERSHQLDTTGATGAGSVRIQDAYQVDPNELRSLPPGVAYVVTAGRAARVAVARTADQPARTRPTDSGKQRPGDTEMSMPVQASTGPQPAGTADEESWLR